jgi:hypothetical protein
MITWDNFYLFALPAIVLWGAGAVFALFSKERSRWAIGLTLSGILVFAAFITGFWLSLQRPPLRTMGETRLWYSFFMGISGLLTYLRWKYPWILSFSTVVGAVFAIINILKPEIHDRSLMPALQSPWFVPHVTVYMFSYSVLGCAFILRSYFDKAGVARHVEIYNSTAPIIRIDFNSQQQVVLTKGSIEGWEVGQALELEDAIALTRKFHKED